MGEGWGEGTCFFLGRATRKIRELDLGIRRSPHPAREYTRHPLPDARRLAGRGATMITSTVENYLKRIYLEHQETRAALVPMGRLAASVGVTPGTATSMIKTLADAGLVAYEPRGGVRLTRKGEKLALHVLRRHRIVELFLVKVLGVDWSDVHKEAEELEHAISESLLERIAAYLGHPGFDPHGDPIPTAEGTIEKPHHGG